MRDIVFNLVPENVFTAPFQRFQTLQVVPPGNGKNKLGMDAMESGYKETQLVGNLAEEVANVQRSPAEAHFEGKVVDGANVLGLVAAAAALGAAAAIRKEEGKMVVEVKCVYQIHLNSINHCLPADLHQLGLPCIVAARICSLLPLSAWPSLLGGNPGDGNDVVAD